MKEKIVSSGFVRLGQLILLLFLLPFLLLFTFLLLRKPSFDDFIILVPILAICFLIFKTGFSYADIYSRGDLLVMKKIFVTIVRTKKDLEKVQKGLLPFSYYLVFKDQTKVYFQYVTLNLFDNLGNACTVKIFDSIKAEFSEVDKLN